MVAIEQPTYPGAMQAFDRSGPALPVDWDADGPARDVSSVCASGRPEALSTAAERHIRAGSRWSRRSDAVAGGRRRHKVPIVEDGFDGSLYTVLAPASAQGSRSIRPRLYIGKFSKILPRTATGLAGGALARDGATAGGKQLPTFTRGAAQAAGNRSASCAVDRHVTRVTVEYARRRAC